MVPAVADRRSTGLPARYQPPAGRPGDSRRERLHRLLDRDPAPVTLVCGPAGSGKTTLLASWAADTIASGGMLAWLTLDRYDRPAGALWSEILEALLSTGSFGERSRLHELRAPPREIAPTFVDTVTAEIAALGQPAWLVLDDLHVLADEDAFASLRLLVERRPPALRLVLSGRVDPPVGLARLRIEGRLRELRASDLAFTVDETAAFLRSQGVDVPRAAVEVLHARTEGWAAGLRIASIALLGSEDPAEAISRFSGDDHAVADYLVSEVLATLPAPIREFLLRTSTCSLLDVELARRLSGRDDAAEMLDDLERRNLFTTRSDRSGQTFRYHELFRTYLAAELHRTAPRMQQTLHRVAAEWLVPHGHPLHAMGHLRRADDLERLTELVREHGLAAVLEGHAGLLADVLDHLDAAARGTSVLALLGAVAAMELDDLDAADGWLAEVDLGHVIDGTDRALAVLAAATAVARARYTASITDALLHLEATGVEVAASSDLALFALHERGAARYHIGDYGPAVEDLRRAADLARATGRDAVHVACLSLLAGAYLGMSRVEDMRRCADQAIDLAERRGWSRSRMVTHAYLVDACAAYTAGDRPAVEANTASALASLGRHPEPDVELSVRSLEFVLAALGPEPREALASFRAAFRRLAHAQMPPLVMAVAGPLVLRICLALGDRHWAREFAEAASAHAPEPGEPALLRALLQLDAGKADAARRTLDPIVRGEASCHLVTTEIRARLLAAEVDHLHGRATLAHEQLLEALRLAGPLDLRRPFCEQPGVLELLRTGRGRFGHLEPFVGEVLAAAAPGGAAGDDAKRLTPTELAVLQDLPSLLTLEEIAAAHAVSINTVKTHVRGIYRKLGVSTRRDAVRTARRRGLL